MRATLLISLIGASLLSNVALAKDGMVLVKDTRIVDGAKITLRIEEVPTGKFSATLTSAWFDHSTGRDVADTSELAAGLECSLADAGRLLTCGCQECGEDGQPFKLTIEEVGKPASYTARTSTWAKDPVTGDVVELTALIARGMRLVDR